MANHWTPAQPDLFDKPLPSMRLGATEEAKVMEQLQILLMEVMTTLGNLQEEEADDQDHT